MAYPWNLASSRKWHRSIDHIRVHIRFIIATTTLPRIVSEIKRDIGGKLRWLHTAFYVTTDWTILRCFFDNQARSLLLDGLLSSSDGVNWFCKSPVFTHISSSLQRDRPTDRQTDGKRDLDSRAFFCYVTLVNSRDFRPISRFISATMQDTVKVTMEDK